MSLLLAAALVFLAGDPHVRPFPAAPGTPTPAPKASGTPIVAAPPPGEASAAVAPSPTPTPAPAPTPTGIVAKRRADLLGDDRAAATSAVEEISLVGGGEALVAIADYIAHWKGDREMERHGYSALTRLPIEPSALTRVLRDDADPGHRAWAAWTAGQHEMAAAGDDLLKALKDDDSTVRARAVASLAILGDQRAMDPLMHILVHDPDPDTRQKASEAVALLSTPRPEKPSIDGSLAKLRSSDSFQRLAGVAELEKAHDRAAVGPLLSLLKDERDVDVRRASVAALGNLGDEIAVPALIEIAKHDSLQVRQYAIASLATLDDGRAVDTLAQLAHDDEPTLRKFSLRALAYLRRDGSLGPMLEGLADPVPDVRSEAIKGIARLGEKRAADRIAERLGKELDPSIRQFECATLGNLGEVGKPEHERALVKELDDDDPGVRSAAVGALAKIGTKNVSEKPLERLIEREQKKKPGERDGMLLDLAADAAARISQRTR